ncbi:MAG: NUDIX hydrolase [Ktedonobacteraceae bacterium]
MTMVCFDSEDTRFNYRVAGITLHDNHVLLCQLEGANYWFLPGGRVDMGETSIAALRREMQEELQADVQVGRILWIVESFYVESRNYHELALYYMMDFAPEAPVSHATKPFIATDGHTSLIFQWFALQELDQVTLYPPFLVEGLRKLPEQTMHVVDGR